ncbi:MAG: ATP-binding protein [Bacteroidales bacterium]|nr:ATP-binding protein [Bacteroidales bacterium]MDD4602598.1 ATP-binding protein [Bacteroidales bacterium]
MKFHEPRNLALLNAGIISGVYAFLFFLTILLIDPHSFSHPGTFLALFISLLLLFSISYFIFRFTLERFIYSKIRLIYKSIHLVKAGKKEKATQMMDSHMIEHVQEEVAQWETEKVKEIEQLKQLELYRRDFIGNVSHELKTPLFNIQGYVETLLDGGLEDPTINREYLKRTDKSIDRLIKIVEDLDEISLLESGQIKLKPAYFDVVSLTREVVESMEMKAQKHNIRITLKDPGKPIFVSADKEKIRQVLTNIIDNSIRYGKKEGGNTKITFFDMGENILTEITDSGIGIETEDIPRVFERFYRTGQGRAATKKGKGLGLAIVKHIIEAHEQTINIRSTIGVGTTFGFTLKKQ